LWFTSDVSKGNASCKGLLEDKNFDENLLNYKSESNNRGMTLCSAASAEVTCCICTQ